MAEEGGLEPHGVTRDPISNRSSYPALVLFHSTLQNRGAANHFHIHHSQVPSSHPFNGLLVRRDCVFPLAVMTGVRLGSSTPRSSQTIIAVSTLDRCATDRCCASSPTIIARVRMSASPERKPCGFRSSSWCPWVDSNHRSPPSQGGVLFSYTTGTYF